MPAHKYKKLYQDKTPDTSTQEDKKAIEHYKEKLSKLLQDKKNAKKMAELIKLMLSGKHK
ncbi:MAG: hypothetical protein JNM93_11955 [Bacteriovoracaceae bacterium]|nr:hypothetical protein [Bacteriovoracaceae bacterium]